MGSHPLHVGPDLQIQQQLIYIFMDNINIKEPCKLQQTILQFFYLYLWKNISLDLSCESSAQQRIHMKYQVLFSLKNNEKKFKIGALWIKL